jgi:hypothetical protein
MKKIRLVLDYIPNHKASREFTLRLFEDLVSHGIECELAIIGLERNATPKVRIINHPDEISEEMVQFMNTEIREKATFQSLDEDTVLEWNKRVLAIRSLLLGNPSTINIDIWECAGYFATLESGRGKIESKLRATNGGNITYLEYPIHNNNIQNPRYQSIVETLTQQIESSPYEPNKDTGSLISILRELQEKEIDIETLEQHVEINHELLNSQIRRK